MRLVVISCMVYTSPLWFAFDQYQQFTPRPRPKQFLTDKKVRRSRCWGRTINSPIISSRSVLSHQVGLHQVGFVGFQLHRSTSKPWNPKCNGLLNTPKTGERIVNFGWWKAHHLPVVVVNEEQNGGLDEVCPEQQETALHALQSSEVQQLCHSGSNKTARWILLTVTSMYF